MKLITVIEKNNTVAVSIQDLLDWKPMKQENSLQFLVTTMLYNEHVR
jgi:hypothetical protein